MFARLRYTARLRRGCAISREGPGWRHDYPTADRKLTRAVAELTSVDARVDSSVVLAADDPELRKYPIAYLTDPGCWSPTDAEVRALRAYLLKGGLLIVDDFTFARNVAPRRAWPSLLELARETFEEQIRRVLPGGRLVRIDPQDRVFTGFLRLDAASPAPFAPA